MPHPISLLAALAVSALGGAAAQDCFGPGVVLPRPDRVRPNLSTGAAGAEAFDAILAGDQARVRALLLTRPDLAGTAVPPATYPDFSPDGQYGDLLTFAVAACDSGMLAALLDAGLPPDGALAGQALDLSLHARDLGMAEMLLRAGASPDPQKAGGAHVLATAAALGRLDAARLLIRHGLDVGWVDQFGRGHLDTAAAMNSFEVAEALVDAGANPWLVDRDGVMPVHVILRAPILATPAQGAAQDRLRAGAPRPGLPWPPPDAATIRAGVLSGKWPTPATRAAGMEVSAEALDGMRERGP